MASFVRKLFGGGDQPAKPTITSSTVKIDSKVFHLRRWSSTGLAIQPYVGDLIGNQRFYCTIDIQTDQGPFVFQVEAAVLTVAGDLVEARWQHLSGYDSRQLKRFLGKFGDGGNEAMQPPMRMKEDGSLEPLPTEGAETDESQAAEAGDKPAEKPK
jgi:hypothetical protein